jgi:hypothetical protein
VTATTFVFRSLLTALDLQLCAASLPPVSHLHTHACCHFHRLGLQHLPPSLQSLGLSLGYYGSNRYIKTLNPPSTSTAPGPGMYLDHLTALKVCMS